MRLRAALIAAVLVALAQACGLSPQPLPPSDDRTGSNSGASSSSNGGFGGGAGADASENTLSMGDATVGDASTPVTSADGGATAELPCDADGEAGDGCAAEPAGDAAVDADGAVDADAATDGEASDGCASDADACAD
jgi:hypothetical protein